MGQSELLLRLLGPIPHPVDGDWRFHPEAHQIFINLVHRYSSKTVCALASPSLVRSLYPVVHSIALADANPAWQSFIADLDVQCSWGDVGLAADRWSREFDLVIVDPPWYPLEIRRFLTVASLVAKRHGTILLSWPAEGTRPGISREWQDLLSFSSRLGLDQIGCDRLLLRYATPFYEGRALLAAGLHVLADLRRLYVA
jgi:hypothetical protein